MRTHVIIASLLAVLTGCRGRYDGSWLVFYTLESDTSDPDNRSIGVEYRTLASLYRTSDQIAIGIGSNLLTGTREGRSFEVTRSLTVDLSTEDCATYAVQEDESIEGEFTEDLSFEGELQLTDQMTVRDCDWSDDTEEAQRLTYDLTGILVDSAPGAHGTSSVSWGYIPFNVY